MPSGPSRRPRGTIERSVLVRLDGEQAATIATLEAATGRSAAAVLLGYLPGSSAKPALPSAPAQILPAAADAAMLVTLRQLGGVLGKGIRDHSLPEAEAKRALLGIESLINDYHRRIRNAASK